MRLTIEQTDSIRRLALQIAGDDVQVRVFGSRLDDNARGGDLDLMLELRAPVQNPSLLAAQFSAKVMRLMQGRKVDVVITAPNLLRLPIHDVALREGHLL